MHELFTKVLSDRDLSRAGDLFSVFDSEIVNDLSEVLSDIGPIISHADYLKNTNDQSVVEICVTRVLSCIRETKTAERYCSALIHLLEHCLIWNLQPVGTAKEDPPHAKIAADIISSIFLNYEKKELMKMALPVAIQFLPKGNRELSRNLACYLSLAAIDYAVLLTPHVSPLIDSIMAGNYGLLRVLGQIYEVSPEVVLPYAALLIVILPQCDLHEKLAIFQLYLLIAQQSAVVLQFCVPQLCDYIYDHETAPISMQILLKLAEQHPHVVDKHFEKVVEATKANPTTLSVGAQILATAGRTNKEKAQIALDFVLEHLLQADCTSQTILQQEAAKICCTYPILFTDKVLACVKNSQSQQKLSSSNKTLSTKTSGGVTIVNLSNSRQTTLQSLILQSEPCPSTILKKPTIITHDNVPIHRCKIPNTTAINPVSVITKTAVSVQSYTTGDRMLEKSKIIRCGSNCPKEKGSSVIIYSNFNTESYCRHIDMSVDESTNANIAVLQQDSGQVIALPPSPLNSAYMRRVKLGDSRSTGRLHSTVNTHRSMTRLNVTGSSVGGLHKSMTRLSSSQHINSGSQSNKFNINIHSNILQYSSGNLEVQTCSTIKTSSTATAKSLTTPSRPGYVTPVPPLSNNVIITGHNKWGIPSTQVTSGGVTVTTSSTKVRPHSQGPKTLLNSSNVMLKYSTDCLNQSIGSISIQQNSVSVHHASPALPQQNNTNKKSVMSLPFNGNKTHEVVVSGPTTNVTVGRNDNTSRTLLNANNSILDQRMSTFEPYQIMRDPVQQFCEKHFSSIKKYMDELSQCLPPPTRCSIEDKRAKKVAKLHFACQIRGPHCLYSKSCFTMRTRNPKTWIHLIFLDFQIRHYVKEKCVLSTREPGISNLKNIWQILKCENRSFTELVTSQFPTVKDREILVNELRQSGFLDVFEVSKTDQTNLYCNELEFQWGCFLCNHPEKVFGFLNGSNQPMIEGQLKEKKGKWRLFRRWRTRYFTLSGAHLSCKGSSGGESIDVNQIRSVKVSRGARNIPKAFEIFTADQKLILKPKNGKNAEEWVQCLNIVVAHSQSRVNSIAKTNSLPFRGTGSCKPLL